MLAATAQNVPDLLQIDSELGSLRRKAAFLSRLKKLVVQHDKQEKAALLMRDQRRSERDPFTKSPQLTQ